MSSASPPPDSTPSRAASVPAWAPQSGIGTAAGSRVGFLLEASRVLAASLEPETTLASAARLAVPALCEHCLVFLVDATGTARRVAAEGVEPEASLLEAMDPHGDGATFGVPRAVREQSVELGDTDGLGAFGPGTRICLPLTARGHTLGALVLLAGERVYTPDDLALAEDLAQRAALALDNARLYHEAERANQAKSELLAAVSHEFRTPLQVILGFVELLRVGLPEPIPQSALKQVDAIGEAADHLLHLFEELLGLSRLEAGREALRVEAFDVAALLHQMRYLIEPLARKKGLAFTAELPPEPITVVSDMGKVRQILYNLLSNAAKFTDQGTITLTASQQGDWLTLAVRDTGIGMTRDQATQVWDSFWQADRSGGGGRGGVGLGLAITHRLAGMLGGSIEVASELGEGTTFLVRLPVRGPERRK